MAVFETYWRLLVKRAYSLEGKLEYCRQCWQSLALENLPLKIDNISKSHSNPQFVMYQRSTNAVSGGAVPGSSLSFRPSLDKLLGNGSVKAAYLALLIRDNRNENPYPVHVGYYWSPQHSKWLPMGIHIIGGDKKIPFATFSKKMARRTVCLNNLKQIGIANLLYAEEDSRGSFSPRMDGNDSDVNRLFPHYVSDADLFLCPFTRNVVRTNRQFNSKTGNWELEDLSYKAIHSGHFTGVSYIYYAFMGKGSVKYTEVPYYRDGKRIDDYKRKT